MQGAHPCPIARSPLPTKNSEYCRPEFNKYKGIKSNEKKWKVVNHQTVVDVTYCDLEFRFHSLPIQVHLLCLSELWHKVKNEPACIFLLNKRRMREKKRPQKVTGAWCFYNPLHVRAQNSSNPEVFFLPFQQLSFQLSRMNCPSSWTTSLRDLGIVHHVS